LGGGRGVGAGLLKIKFRTNHKNFLGLFQILKFSSVNFHNLKKKLLGL